MSDDSGSAPITAGGGGGFAYPHACRCTRANAIRWQLIRRRSYSLVDRADVTPRFSTVDITDATSSSAGYPFRSSVMDMLVSNTGLTIVYEPESGFPVVDIVLVHGLQGHPYKTWACKKNQIDSSSATASRIKVFDGGNGSRKSYDRVVPRFESSIIGHDSSQEHGGLSSDGKDAREVKVFWPKDLLPIHYPNARILVYGYDTRVTNYFSGPTNENSIHSHSKDLLSSLAAARRFNSPLILIAHSLGGIVVKEMLAKSSASTDDRLNDVVNSTAAVMFLGTPHRGSRGLATLGDRARSIVNALMMRTNPSILDALRLKTNDLERAQESFSAAWNQHNFRVKTFQEGLGLTGLNLGPFGKKVVPDDSSLLGDSRERAETIQANHMDMCRFTGIDDPNYRRICGEITPVYESIARVNATTEHHSRSQPLLVKALKDPPLESEFGRINQRERAFLQSLAFPNMDQRTQDLEMPAEGTCAWFFKHDTFVDWVTHRKQDQSCGLLWLRGKPGSGKSTLLKEAFFKTMDMSASEGLAASFFFNAKGDSLEHSQNGMLRSLLHQMCSQHPELLKELLYFARTRRAFNREGIIQWEKAELRAFFKAAILGHKKRAIVFIDAIDECDSDSAREVANFWRDVTKTAHCAGVQLSVCLSSRHFPAISVNDCPEIVMEDHNHSDIVDFVRRRLGLGMTAKHVDQQAIQEKILKKSGGVFLWVSLVVEDILQKNDEGKGLRFLLKHLDSVPQELEDLFSQLLTSAPFPTMVAKMFQWALLPTKQLRLHEWHHVLAFIGDDPPSSLREWQHSDSYTESDEQLERRIAYLSRGLLGFNVRSSSDNSHEPADDSMSDRAGAGSLDLNTGETRVVQVIHESVRQYFMEGAGFTVLNPASAGKPLAHAHLSIMNVCLDYLLIEELDALFEARKLAQRRTKNQLARDRDVSARILGPETLERASTAGGAGFESIAQQSSPARPAWRRASSVASFGSASSHDGGQSPVVPVDDYFPAHRKRPHSSDDSDQDLLVAPNLKKFKGSAENYDIADRWLKEQSAGDQHDTAAMASPASLQSSINGCSQTLEAHTALLSYAIFELFTHAQKADAENLDPIHIVARLHDTAWDRWKALREDVDERTEFLYFAAYMGLSSWLKADRVWKEDEVISSMKLAIDFEDSNALGKLLDAFPAVGDRSIEHAIEAEDHEVIGKLVTAFPSSGFERDISRELFDFLANEPDHVLLQAYLSRHPSHSREEDDLISPIRAKKYILERQDDRGRTVLHLAVARRDIAVIRVLLGHGADVSAVDVRLHTPLHLACANDPDNPGWYFFWSPNVRVAIIELLLSHGAPVNAFNAHGQTPLLMTCSNIGWHPQLNSSPRPSTNETNFHHEVLDTVDFLLKHGADPTMRDFLGSLPLHEACHTSSVNPPAKFAIVSKLLDYKAPVNAAAKWGETPLHAACSFPEVEIVKELLRRGADPTLRDRQGYNPLHIASAQSVEEVVETLLSLPGALVDAKDDRGATPLHLTCVPNQNPDAGRNKRRIGTIRRLLAHGAKAYTVRDHDGFSAADVAMRYGFAGTLELMAQESCDSPDRGPGGVS